MKNRHWVKLGDELTDYLDSCWTNLGKDIIKTLTIYTEYWCNLGLFRASPRHLGKPWRDWVLHEFSNSGILPCQIWCFVDLRYIHKEAPLDPGIWAVIEAAYEEEDENEMGWGEIFVPYTKEIHKDEEGIKHNS